MYLCSQEVNRCVMGVRYDSEEQRFVFDFEHDGYGDIVSLIGRRDLMADAIV